MKNNVLGLYNHNLSCYENIISGFIYQNIVAIIRATGTGKTYNALQLAYDNQDKKILYIVPSLGIIEYIKEIIDENPLLNFERDFGHIDFRTYQSFVNMTDEEIKLLNADIIILDEFHHLGAPVWGDRINKLIRFHPAAKVLGMTAYPVRDRGTSYERDMTRVNSDEIFSDKVVSFYDICDAMIDGVLPKPIYKSSFIHLEQTAKNIESKLECLDTTSEKYRECKNLLKDIKKRIHEAPSAGDILKKNLKKNGKYIYFCPFMSQKGVNDIDTIMETTKQYLIENGWNEEDIIFYKTTSNMEKEGKQNRDSFYRDVNLEGKPVDNKLRIMFAINQYNEGIHAPKLDGVIMGRETNSDIVFFEQLGRALSVNAKDKKEEYKKLISKTLEELLEECRSRNIEIKPDSSKEQIIEKMLATVIIDLTNNYDFIKSLETNLQNRIKEIKSNGANNNRAIYIKDAHFDIEMINQNLYETLSYVMERLTITWDDKFLLAQKYYEHYNNLSVPKNFKTINGYDYDENGINLHNWILSQKKNFQSLSVDQQTKLLSIGFVLNVYEDKWEKMYSLAEKYYEFHKNLLVPLGFKTTNGYEFDAQGKDLRVWINHQRSKFNNLSDEYKIKLNKIGFVKSLLQAQWEDAFLLAKKYYEKYKTLEMPAKYKTVNGYDADDRGMALGHWLYSQKSKFDKLSDEQQEKLLSVGFNPSKSFYDQEWETNYNLAKNYYEKNKHLKIAHEYKTTNGYDYDENGANLGYWIGTQRKKYSSLSEEQKRKLSDIGFIENIKENQWYENYALAQQFFSYYHHLMIPGTFKTINGYDYNENGIYLGAWISRQRAKFEKLEETKRILLLQIGFISDVRKNEKEIEEIATLNNINYKVNKKILSKMSIQEFISKINFLKENGIEFASDETIHEIFWMSSENIKSKYHVTVEEIIKDYYFDNDIFLGV